MKRAVVLFNLGGPDTQEAVRPFLFNLFSDPAIFRLPNPFRSLLAWWVARRRAPLAREIYAKLGGGSPLLALTQEQAQALESQLSEKGEYRVFIAMRYWHPLTDATVREVKTYNPDEIILLPLYPQFSTTTTASSLRRWREEAAKQHVNVPTRAICCYPDHPGFVAGYADLLQNALRETGEPYRILFSAHGLPESVIRSGDPYQYQVERSVAAIMEHIGKAIDHNVCYQSRVGPLKWIGPSTEEEILRAGKDGVGIILVPVAFVSEHSETLVELDIEYRHLAEENGVPFYIRVPALGTHPEYINALADICLNSEKPISPAKGCGSCGSGFSGCPIKSVADAV